MLLLKKHLVHLVRMGKKRQTIRLWVKAAVRAGQVSYTPGLGRMRITAVDVLPELGALTEEDARLDGFETLGELRAEIVKIYGESVKGRVIYRIKFEWPIDAAGEKLVLGAPVNNSIPSSAKRKSSSPPVADNSKLKSRMTAAQRQSLRMYLLSRAPTKK